VRRFTDEDGQSWDVVLGRESFGALYALFVPAAGNPGSTRQTPLTADSYAGAEAELSGLSPSELGSLLQRSELKTLE
jgi:hypothetical protein